jgi:hypothetical protein
MSAISGNVLDTIGQRFYPMRMKNSFSAFVSLISGVFPVGIACGANGFENTALKKDEIEISSFNSHLG